MSDEKKTEINLKMTIETVKMFDDFYYMGSRGVGIYIVKTSEGLVFIDSSATVNAYEEIVVPSLKKLGLENEKILAVLLTHGHFDHYLGAKGIQLATGCDVGLSYEDTVFMLSSKDNLDNDPGIDVPQITMLLEDGKDYVFGDHSIHCLFAPGHTPGCLNYTLDVHEGDETHRVAIMGGYGIFGPGAYLKGEYPLSRQRAIDDALLFASSCAKFWLHCKETNCDVYLNPHPHLCDLFRHVEENETRKEGERNAFVIGVDGVKNWILERFDACLEAAGKFATLKD